ncbi:MAG: type II toxin-antitoxin system RelE/ParE family toxin [Chitinophagaceae bacterium]
MKFVYLPTFVKRLKELAKKYPSVKSDFSNLLKELESDPERGTSLGKDCYKIRLAIKSKGRGKSGGARIITCVKIRLDAIYFLTIYDKADQDSISDSELKAFIKYIENEYGTK